MGERKKLEEGTGWSGEQGRWGSGEDGETGVGESKVEGEAGGAGEAHDCSELLSSFLLG